MHEQEQRGAKVGACLPVVADKDEAGLGVDRGVLARPAAMQLAEPQVLGAWAGNDFVGANGCLGPGTDFVGANVLPARGRARRHLLSFLAASVW